MSSSFVGWRLVHNSPRLTLPRLASPYIASPCLALLYPSSFRLSTPRFALLYPASLRLHSLQGPRFNSHCFARCFCFVLRNIKMSYQIAPVLRPLDFSFHTDFTGIMLAFPMFHIFVSFISSCINYILVCLLC